MLVFIRTLGLAFAASLLNGKEMSKPMIKTIEKSPFNIKTSLKMFLEIRETKISKLTCQINAKKLLLIDMLVIG